MPEASSSPDRGTVLVTGGAGYIGSHTCKALRAAGYTPVTFDNLVYGHAEAVRWGVLERGDIGDRARLDAVISDHAPTAIVHFAAYAYVGESVTDPGKYYRNNVAGTLTLLEAARDHGIGRFIFSSTCATYGVPSEIPIVETTPQAPINPYGASKLMIERVLADFGVAHDLRWIALRYFNAAGADPGNETGECHDPETHLIPLALDAASGRRPALTIFGKDYDTADGTCVRDYIHVSDLADAHVLALAALERGVASQPLNLGNGNGFSVLDVVRTVEAITGLKVPHDFGPRRAGDPPALISNARRARETLGWQPRYADLDAIVRTAWAWHQRA
jgi:UDP-arabinose 4-epimerase